MNETQDLGESRETPRGLLETCHPARAARFSRNSRAVIGCILCLATCFAATTLPGCSAPVTRRYYTLALAPESVLPRIDAKEDLWVHDVEIAPIYNRPQIVYRYSPNELQFHTSHVWADRPQRMLTQLLVQAFSTSGLFRSVTSRLGNTPPAYQLETTVQALEQLDSGDIWYAHVAMSLRLSRFKDGQIVWQYHFDERLPINQDDVGLAVRAMSEILQAEMDIMKPQIEAVLLGKNPLETGTTGEEADRGQAGAATGGEQRSILESHERLIDQPASAAIAGEHSPDAEAASGSTDHSLTSELEAEVRRWKQSAQYASDKSELRPGKGAIFLPSLCGDPHREPRVAVYKQDKEVVSGAMAERISVVPGTYQVYLGSGTLAQRMVREVTVDEARVSIVPPDWAVLDISVVDKKFIPFRGSYELISMDDFEYFGVGYGADEELGEVTQAWVLPAGLYKIVKPGLTYRARTNFVTVRLNPGSYVPFTLVLDEATFDFLGAGVSEYELAEPEQDQKWKLHTVIGGDMLITERSPGFSLPAGTSVAFNLFSDALLKYRNGPHFWSTRLEMEEGFSIQSETEVGQVTVATDAEKIALQAAASGESTSGIWEELKVGNKQTTRDRLYLNSIYIYELLPWIGPYVRTRGETQLTERMTNFSFDSTDLIQVTIQNEAEEEVAVLSLTENRRLAKPWSPLKFKEGVGVNFRLAHTTFLDLDLRTGLGLTQYLPRLGENVATSDPVVLTMTAPRNVFGPESTILASARFTRSLRATTEFDLFIPAQGLFFSSVAWRSSISLQLGQFATLIYALNLERNREVFVDDAENIGADFKLPVATEHNIQLRFWFTPIEL